MNETDHLQGFPQAHAVRQYATVPLRFLALHGFDGLEDVVPEETDAIALVRLEMPDELG